MPSFLTPDGHIDRYAVQRWAVAEAREDWASYEARNSDAAPSFLQCLKSRLRQGQHIAQMAKDENAARRARIQAAAAPRPSLPPLSDAELAAINAEETAVRSLYNAW